MSSTCKIVGNLNLSSIGFCITSISVSSNTEISKIGDEIIQGPTIGTLNLGGYAKLKMYGGVGGSANTSINYIQKYDCDNDIMYLLFAGGGESSVSGDVDGMATILHAINVSHKNMDASTVNGPTEVYFENTTNIGYGLRYSGGPLSFSTESPVSISSGDWGTAYLQSFSLNCTPGTLPTCDYSFIFSPNNNIEVLPKR